MLCQEQSCWLRPRRPSRHVSPSIKEPHAEQCPDTGSLRIISTEGAPLCREGARVRVYPEYGRQPCKPRRGPRDPRSLAQHEDACRGANSDHDGGEHGKNQTEGSEEPSGAGPWTASELRRRAPASAATSPRKPLLSTRAQKGDFATKARPSGCFPLSLMVRNTVLLPVSISDMEFEIAFVTNI